MTAGSIANRGAMMLQTAAIPGHDLVTHVKMRA